MKRSLYLFIKDILDNIELIKNSTKSFSKEDFKLNRDIIDATIRRLEIIGEAVKNIPIFFRKKYPEIPWRDIASLRDIVIHTYFKVDLDTLWNIIDKDIPIFQEQILKIKKDLEKN